MSKGSPERAALFVVFDRAECALGRTHCGPNGRDLKRFSFAQLGR